ncbi:MAG: hypothetical protein QXU18_13405, partial [Thermoplasmatales archaeon]
MYDSVNVELFKFFQIVEYAEDLRNGESYSVMFPVDLYVSPKEFIQDEINVEILRGEVTLELLEVEKESDVYPEDAKKLFDDFLKSMENLGVPFNDTSLYLMSEVVSSYENGIYDGTAVLCRAAIDSAIYLACIYKKVPSSLGDLTFERKLPKAFCKKNTEQEVGNLNWGHLTKEALSEGLASKDELDKIDKEVRDLGNFAAHLGRRQIRELDEWLRTHKDVLKRIAAGEKVPPKEYPPGYKLRTSRTE